jgi:hypothetical protein
LPTRNSSCLRPTHVTPRFALRKWGHSGQHGLGFAIERWQRSVRIASFGSGLVRTARTINLDKHKDERRSVVTESSIQAPTPWNPRFNQLRKGSRVTPQLPVRRPVLRSSSATEDGSLGEGGSSAITHGLPVTPKRPRRLIGCRATQSLPQAAYRARRPDILCRQFGRE